LLHQHGDIVVIFTHVQDVLPPLPWRALAISPLRVAVDERTGGGIVLSYPCQLIAPSKERTCLGPLLGGAGLEETTAPGQGMAVQQISVLDRTARHPNDNLHVAALREDRELILRNIGGAANVGTVVSFRA
jgi:hypothetical protein